MNNLAFIQKVAEAYKMNAISPIKIYSEDMKVVVNINGQTWKEDTLDQCINGVKQSLAISFLEQKEVEK